jgi:hypothetical protein
MGWGESVQAGIRLGYHASGIRRPAEQRNSGSLAKSDREKQRQCAINAIIDINLTIPENDMITVIDRERIRRAH